VLRISVDQDEALQAWLDLPLVDVYREALAPDAEPLGMGPEELHARVAAGLRLARRAGAAEGFQRNAFVALAVLVSPTFDELPGFRPVMEDRRMPLEARLRFLTTLLLREPGKVG
jgi:hypothetical protein